MRFNNQLIFTILFIFIHFSCSENNETLNHPAYKNVSIKPFTEAIEADPKDASLYYKRSVALAGINMDSLALIDIDKALLLDGSNLTYLKGKGSLLMHLNKPTEAIAVFEKCLKIQPQELSLSLHLSNAYLYDNNPEKAEKIVQEVIMKDRSYSDAYYWYAQIKASQKDTAAATAMLNKAIQLDTLYYDASLLLADYYAMQGNPAAVPQYLRTFMMDTLEALPLFQIGYFYEKQNMPEKAKKAYEDCIIHDPDFTDAYIQTGKILLQQDSLQKAKRVLSIAVKTEPNNDEAYYNLGLAYEKLGITDSASLAYTNAISFRNDNAEAKERLKKILELKNKE